MERVVGFSKRRGEKGEKGKCKTYTYENTKKKKKSAGVSLFTQTQASVLFPLSRDGIKKGRKTRTVVVLFFFNSRPLTRLTSCSSIPPSAGQRAHTPAGQRRNQANFSTAPKAKSNGSDGSANSGEGGYLICRVHNPDERPFIFQKTR